MDMLEEESDINFNRLDESDKKKIESNIFNQYKDIMSQNNSASMICVIY